MTDQDLLDAPLQGLDQQQRAAVTAPGGLVAVIAAAGSGKTTVLSRRIQHRIVTGTADPSHVVAITFTRDAAWELKRRLRRERLHDQVTAGTFHAAAYSLLRQRWADQRRATPTVVADRRRFVAEVMGDKSRNASGSGVSEVCAEIDWARARLITPEAYEAEARASGRSTSVPRAAVAERYQEYEELKVSRRLIDLDDLLGRMLEEMSRDPGYAEVVRWRFRHLHLDEAQDMNPLQHAVLEAWRGGRDDLFLVGDPAQAIYGWNGAEPGLLLDVERHYPGVTIVRLDQNYRSSPQVIDVGRHLLARAGLPTTITSTRPEGPPVQLHAFPDEHAEAKGVVRLVQSARPPGGRYGAIAVLARTNAQASLVTTELRAAGIPVRARRGRGPVDRVLSEASTQGGVHRLAAWATEVLSQPLATEASPGDTPSVDPMDLARRKVAAVVDEFISETGGGDGRAFASWARSNDAVAEVTGDDVDGVDVLTFHGAKGREWATVILVGFESRSVPHSSARNAAQQAEEIRLAYVAVTRSVANLFITWAERRGGRTTGRSPLLEGLSLEAAPASAPPEEVADLIMARRSAEPSRRNDRLAALHTWRRTAARAAVVPEAVVCSDATLRALADHPVATVDDLAALLGPTAARHHAPRLLPLLTSDPQVS